MTSAIAITPLAAADAYSRSQNTGLTADTDFGASLQSALRDALNTGHEADSLAADAISGNGSLTDVVTAITHAELTLQTATAIRDRVVQAYQDIMKMPI